MCGVVVVVCGWVGEKGGEWRGRGGEVRRAFFLLEKGKRPDMLINPKVWSDPSKHVLLCAGVSRRRTGDAPCLPFLSIPEHSARHEQHEYSIAPPQATTTNVAFHDCAEITNDLNELSANHSNYQTTQLQTRPPAKPPYHVTTQLPRGPCFQTLESLIHRVFRNMLNRQCVFFRFEMQNGLTLSSFKCSE